MLKIAGFLAALAVTALLGGLTSGRTQPEPLPRQCSPVATVLTLLEEARLEHRILRGDAMTPFTEYYDNAPGDKLTFKPEYVMVIMVPNRGLGRVGYVRADQICAAIDLPLYIVNMMMAGA